MTDRRITSDLTRNLLGPLSPLEQQHAPAWLYVAGHVEWLAERPKVSIVGSRKASVDGVRRASRLTRELVDAGVIVVSGLALGIDAAAHTAAIEAGGRTIAVVGTALDQVYPDQHRALQDRLAIEHAVVSQFPPGHPTGRGNFPRRNRTMALMVDASVIVEASDGSGTLSQGWEALRLNRPLFLMRNVVEQSGLAWPSRMLDYGAMVLDHTDELLDRLPLGAGNPLAALA
jgi:DNA processing protein